MKSTIPDNFQKVKSSAITLLKGKQLSPKIEEDDPNKRVTLTINWIVSLLKDLFKKVNNQSELIADLMNKILDLMEPKETIEKECNKKCEELEKDVSEKTVILEKALVESHEALQAEIERVEIKNEQLELKYDEVRQRNLKGNLTVCSPQINRNGSVTETLAVRDKARNSIRPESVTEMVVRLVKLKTGQQIPL